MPQQAHMTRVLIIDDDRAVREATQISLAAQGYDVVIAEDGNSGIAIIKKGGIDIAIVDVFMPGMDGLTATQAIHRENPSLPIIAMSGFMFGGPCPTMPHFDAMALEAGAVSTLYKPFRPAELARAIEKAMAPAA
jgi:CheY-like chemotaxis protein